MLFQNSYKNDIIQKFGSRKPVAKAPFNKEMATVRRAVAEIDYTVEELSKTLETIKKFVCVEDAVLELIDLLDGLDGMKDVLVAPYNPEVLIARHGKEAYDEMLELHKGLVESLSEKYDQLDNPK